MKISRSSRFLGLFLLAIVVFWAASCALSRDQQSVITIILPDMSAPAASKNLRQADEARFSDSALTAAPSSLGGFSCFAVNVLGAGIAPDPRFRCRPGGEGPDSLGKLAGFIPVSGGSLDIRVPTGRGRKFQLIGVAGANSCPSIDSVLNIPEPGRWTVMGDPHAFLIGETSADIGPNTTTVAINANYDPANPKPIFENGCGPPPRLTAMIQPTSVPLGGVAFIGIGGGVPPYTVQVLAGGAGGSVVPASQIVSPSNPPAGQPTPGPGDWAYLAPQGLSSSRISDTVVVSDQRGGIGVNLSVSLSDPIVTTGLTVNLDAARAYNSAPLSGCGLANWTDLSGKGNNVSIGGSSQCWAGDGTLASPNAVHFSDTNSYLKIVDNSTLNPATTTSALSVEAWFRTGSLTASQSILDKHIGNNGYSLSIDVSGHANFSIYSLYPCTVTTSVLAASTWYQVVGVADPAAGGVRIYLNGVLSATTVCASYGIGTSPSYLYFGSDVATMASYLQGDLARALVYMNHGLSLAEIVQNCRASASRFGVSCP